MAKGKSQYATWSCTECGTAHDVSYYDKRRDGEIVKQLKKFCPNKKTCRKHTVHKRKDTRKGNA